jgi:hypothetical protein
MFTLLDVSKIQEQKYSVTSIPCPYCNTTITLEITGAQLWLYNNNASIQEVLHDIDISVRERFMTGICGPCWDNMFNPEGEEE